MGMDTERQKAYMNENKTEQNTRTQANTREKLRPFVVQRDFVGSGRFSLADAVCLFQTAGSSQLSGTERAAAAFARTPV